MVSESNEKSLSMTNIFIYLILSGVMAFVQGISAFTVISLISTVSYSVANATKRIVVIVVSILTLKNPVKCKQQIFGKYRSTRSKGCKKAKVKLAGLPALRETVWESRQASQFYLRALSHPFDLVYL